MNKLLTGLFLICAWGMLPAQAPGYMGRKWSAGIEMAAFPRINLLAEETRPLRIQSRLGLDLSRVWSRRDEGGIHLTRLYSSVPYDYGIGRPRVTGTAWMNGWMMGVHYRLFPFLSRGNIAPIGLHHEVRLDYLRYHMTDQDLRFFPDRRADLGTFQDFALGYGLGMSRVFQGSVRVTVGMSSGWIFQVFPETGSRDLDYLRSIGLNRFRGYGVLNVYMRVAHLW